MLVVAVGLLAINAMLYWDHFTGEGKTRTRSQELASEIDATEAEVERLRQQIASIDIEELNSRISFVNLEIDRRRFAWSRLFDQLAEVQPGSVRLHSMTPEFTEESASRSRRRSGSRSRRQQSPDGVTVALDGVAKDSEAILEFIDALFLHAAFSEPDLEREALRDDGGSTFTLSVVYRPEALQQKPIAASENAPATDSVEDPEGEDAA
jgi:Tfp pilus assembly protein PilN